MKRDRWAEEVEALIGRLRAPSPVAVGTLVRVVGLTLEARGLQAPLGALCRVTGAEGASVDSEVVGFNDGVLYLMPFTEPVGIGPGARVTLLARIPSAALGEGLLGRVIDGLGQPLDGGAMPPCEDRLGIRGLPLNPMERGAINTPFDVGVRAINGLLTLGRGQRMGLIAGSGVGKSVLMGMLTRGSEADVVVIGLIGERGREVREFVQQTLGPDGLARAVIVAAPADQSPVLRLKATQLTHLIAEYFRDRGKNVLMLVDSLTRVAHAQREVGLAIGEPPTAKGYPPSVFALLPSLIERAGVGRGGHGAITAFYTVLAEGDDANDPIVDIARASLDGQVMLSRRLADAAHYPAIDLAGSISRVMPLLVSPERLRRANAARRLWTLFEQNQDLIAVGAYESGSDREIDRAISKREELARFLQQAMDTQTSLSEAEAALDAMMKE
ncbi:MAG: Flagellum-specific synthase [Pseudomonadota bacterium]